MNTLISITIILLSHFLGLFDLGSTTPAETSVIFSFEDCSSAFSLLFSSFLKITTSTLSSEGFVISTNLDKLQLVGSIGNDLFFGNLTLLDSKLYLLIFVNLFPHLQEFQFVSLESSTSGLQGFFGLQLLSVLFFDSLFDIFHFSVTVLITVLLHGEALFLLDGAGPDLYVVHLLVLLNLEGFTLTAEHILEETHDGVVVEVVLSL